MNFAAFDPRKFILFSIYFQFFILDFVENVDLVEECKATEDSHVTRGYFTCCGSSTRGLPLLSSLELTELWGRCAIEPESLNEDPVISAWRVYRCIVFSRLQGKPLRPTTYAHIVSQKYPVLIREKLISELSALESGSTGKFEVDVECLRRTPYPKVHLVRNIFYDTEWELCKGEDASKKSELPTNRSSTKPGNMKRSYTDQHRNTDFASILCQNCDRSKEIYHRNGDCCSHVPLPFPFLYLPIRYGNYERVGQCAEDLVDDVGLPSDTTFATKLKQLCYPSCEYYLSGVINVDDLWIGNEQIQTQSDIRSLVEKMMPTYFAPKYKDEIQTFIVDNFQTAWAETPTFETRFKLSQRDIRNCDKGKLKNLLASCKAHRLVETMTNLYLSKLCQDEYDSEPDDNHLPHNGTGNRFPDSLEDSSTMVTIDLNWKSSRRSEDDIIESRIKQYFASRNASLQNQNNLNRPSGSRSRPAKSSFRK